MKRFAIFILLGPLIGLLPVILLMGRPSPNAVPLLIGAAYLFGGMAALLTGLVDWWSGNLSRTKRAFVTTAAGFCPRLRFR